MVPHEIMPIKDQSILLFSAVFRMRQNIDHFPCPCNAFTCLQPISSAMAALDGLITPAAPLRSALSAPPDLFMPAAQSCHSL